MQLLGAFGVNVPLRYFTFCSPQTDTQRDLYTEGHTSGVLFSHLQDHFRQHRVLGLSAGALCPISKDEVISGPKSIPKIRLDSSSKLSMLLKDGYFFECTDPFSEFVSVSAPHRTIELAPYNVSADRQEEDGQALLILSTEYNSC